MTNTTWTPDLTQYSSPKYLGLVRALREAIRAGELPAGSQLPTVRDLAWSLKVTPGTVARAYQLATQEGLLAATVGRGTFVASTAPRFGPTQSFYIEREPAQLTGRIDMRSPRLPDVGQGAAFAHALEQISHSVATDWLDYPSQRSERPLREAMLDWLQGRVLGPVNADDVAISYGGQAAVSLIFQCVLRGDRPMVLIEDLAYAGFRHAARLSRAEIMSVEVDEYGLCPDALEAACRRHAPQILCVTTEAQNPTTARMPESRRREIARIAAAYEIQILEDDCYSIANSNLPAIRALAPDRTWYIGSFSKTVSAALRLGYIICPTGMGEAGRLTAQHSFFGMAKPVSDLCLELLTSGEADRIRREVQEGFASQLEAVVNSLGGFDLQWQAGLPFVWLRLPSGWRASIFTRMAENAGVLVRSADEFALVHGRAPNAVRLALPGNESRARVEEACLRLAHLLRILRPNLRSDLLPAGLRAAQMPSRSLTGGDLTTQSAPTMLRKKAGTMQILTGFHAPDGSTDFLGFRKTRNGETEVVFDDGASRRMIWRVLTDPLIEAQLSDGLCHAVRAPRVVPALIEEMRKRAIALEPVGP